MDIWDEVAAELGCDSDEISGTFSPKVRRQIEESAKPRMNETQRDALKKLSDGYKVRFDEAAFIVNPFDQPPGFVSGWVGPIYVGCSPEGQIHS
jgi:hypothetical protein